MIGVAQTLVELITARAVQGVGASILAPSVLAIIATTFAEGPERTRALAWYSVVAGAGSSLGMVVGGIFAGLLSWRLGFLVNIPIGLGLLVAVQRFIPEGERMGGRFDIHGAVASTCGMALLVYGLVNSADGGWLAPPTLWSLAAALGVLGFFVWHEARTAAPIMPLRLFASRERSAAYAARMLFIGSMVAFFFFTAQLMQRVLGYSALQAGLGFLPTMIMTFMSATAIPRLSRMIGTTPMLMGALALIAVGLLWLASFGVGASPWQIALPMALIGIGNGAAMAPLTASGVRGVEARDQGAASGLVNVAHQLGGSLGFSLLVVVFAASAAPDLAPGPGEAVQVGHQISATLIDGAAMNVAAMVLAALFIWPATREPRQRLPQAATAIATAE